MTAHEYFEQIKNLQTDLVDIEDALSKLKKQKKEICDKILEVTREFRESPDDC